MTDILTSELVTENWEDYISEPDCEDERFSYSVPDNNFGHKSSLSMEDRDELDQQLEEEARIFEEQAAYQKLSAAQQLVFDFFDDAENELSPIEELEQKVDRILSVDELNSVKDQLVDQQIKQFGRDNDEWDAETKRIIDRINTRIPCVREEMRKAQIEAIRTARREYREEYYQQHPGAREEAEKIAQKWDLFSRFVDRDYAPGVFDRMYAQLFPNAIRHFPKVSIQLERAQSAPILRRRRSWRKVNFDGGMRLSFDEFCTKYDSVKEEQIKHLQTQFGMPGLSFASHFDNEVSNFVKACISDAFGSFVNHWHSRIAQIQHEDAEQCKRFKFILERYQATDDLKTTIEQYREELEYFANRNTRSQPMIKASVLYNQLMNFGKHSGPRKMPRVKSAPEVTPEIGSTNIVVNDRKSLRALLVSHLTKSKA